MPIDPKQSVYCLAPTVGDGFQRKFTSGNTPEFDPAWMGGDEVIFVSNAVDKPLLATPEMLHHVAGMSKELFVKLARGHNTLSKVKAGENASPLIATYVADLASLIEAAPWKVDPKLGVVPAPARPAAKAAVAEAAAPAAKEAEPAPAPVAKEPEAVAAPAAPEPVKAATVAYCLAESVGAGFKGNFAGGPFEKFDPSWMLGDELVFLASENDNVKPVLAADDIISHAGTMSKEMFAKLYKGNINLTKLARQDEVLAAAGPVLKNLATYLQNLKDILAVAPWDVDPKAGIVAVNRTTVAVPADTAVAEESNTVASVPASAPTMENIKAIAEHVGAEAVIAAVTEMISDALPEVAAKNNMATPKEQPAAPAEPVAAQSIDMATMAGEGAQFYLAKNIGSGYKKAFTDGPYAAFDSSWLWDDQVVFQSEEGKQPRLAVKEMIEAAPCISCGLFKTLYTGLQNLTKMQAAGKSTPAMDLYIQDISRIMVDAPYMVDENDRIVDVPGYFKSEEEQMAEDSEFSDQMTM